nr:T9SS type A sorting domain-containing protein [Saprospiraceae bacterium]
QFLPFKGASNLLDNDVQGVWNAKPEGSSDILSVAGTFFEPENLEATMIFGHSDGDYSFDTDAPGNYDRSLSKVWQAATQGGIFASFSFDLSVVDMSQVLEVVLLSSAEEDLSEAEITSGVIDGNTFTVEDVVPSDGWYYSLGFKTSISGIDAPAADALQFDVSPNPTQNSFRFHIQGQQLGILHIRVLTMAGEEVYSQAFEKVPADYTEIIDPGQLPAGMYLVEVKDDYQTGVRKLVVK